MFFHQPFFSVLFPWSEGTALYVPVRYRPAQLVLDVLQHGYHLIIVPFSRTMEPDVQPCRAIIDREAQISVLAVVRPGRGVDDRYFIHVSLRFACPSTGTSVAVS